MDSRFRDQVEDRFHGNDIWGSGNDKWVKCVKPMGKKAS